MEVLLHNWHNILLAMEGLHLCVESNRTKGEAKNEVRRPAGRAPSDVNSTRQPDVGRTPPCCRDGAREPPAPMERKWKLLSPDRIIRLDGR
jgi:hypothetical protein